MAQNDQIQLFENKRIRTAWDAEKEEIINKIIADGNMQLE